MNTERTRRKTTFTTRASGHHAVVQALGDEHIGLEARAHVDDHMDVKIWLCLLTCSTQIEQRIRQRLCTRFNTTLPHFDYLTQLDRHPDGLRMNVLSRYLIVTGGSVTGLIDQLEKEGPVRREAGPDDRRPFRVLLADADRRHFAEMATERERWLIEMFDGLGIANKDTLYAQLGHPRVHFAQRERELDTREDQPWTNPTQP